MTLNNNQIALLAVIAGAIFLGSAPILFRVGEAGPSAIAFWRVVLSLPFAYIWMRLESKALSNKENPQNTFSIISNLGLNRLTRAQLLTLTLAGLFWIGDLISWHWSLSQTNIANSTFFATSSPLFVTLIAWIFLGERYTRLFFFGGSLTIIGSFALISATIYYGNGSLIGDGLGLITALCFGSYVLAVRMLRRHMGAGSIIFWTGAISAPGFLFASLISNEILTPTTTSGWLALLGLAMITQIAGQGLLAYGLGRVQAGSASILVMLEPIVAAILGWLIFTERLNNLQIVGCTLILIGIVIIRKKSSNS